MHNWDVTLVQTAPRPEVAAAVSKAINALLTRDGYLLEVDANERSLSHRLALYLAEFFPDWDVDCEYNRDGHQPKRLHLDPVQTWSDDECGTTVYPDVIIHHRGTGRNLLAIEIKKGGRGLDADDLKKLRMMRLELHYELGLFVRFSTGTKTVGVEQIQWSTD